jgi:flagellin-like hook-associated protein FlgL
MRQYQHACEEVQARLQALQVQQQPGIQSLSIASQPPQGVLPLLR